MSMGAFTDKLKGSKIVINHHYNMKISRNMKFKMKNDRTNFRNIRF